MAEAQVMNMMKANIAGKPLQDFGELLKELPCSAARV
jgi:hypothetical protein